MVHRHQYQYHLQQDKVVKRKFRLEDDLISDFNTSALDNSPSICTSSGSFKIRVLDSSGNIVRYVDSSKSKLVMPPKEQSKTQSQCSKITPENKSDKSKRGRGKETDPPSAQGGESDNHPSSPPTPSPAQELTNKVIAHFTSHWEAFKNDCLDDVTSLSQLLNDPENGLVKKVSTLETNYTDLQSRVNVLETDRPQSVADSVLQRIQSVENKCDPKRAGSIPFQVSVLEEKMD